MSENVLPIAVRPAIGPLAQTRFPVASGWTVEPLGELGKWLSGGTPRMSDETCWGGNIPWISPKDMKRARLHDAIDHVTEKGLRYGTRLAPEGSLLMVVRGMILAHSFPVARAERAVAFNQDIKALVTRESIDSEFLLWWLQANEVLLLSLTSESSHGTKRMPSDALFSLRVDLPPFDEQRAIAAALSDVDALIGALDRLIAKKRDLKQAAMQQLITGQTRLPGFSGTWERRTIFELAEKRKDLFDDGDWIEAEFLEESGIRLIQTGNIGTGHFEDKDSRKYISAASFKSLNCKELRIGDLLICRLAEPAGRACILPDIRESRMITAVDVTIFRPPTSGVDRRFLVQVFSTREWLTAVSERCGGSTRTRIARGELGKMEIALPPIDEQISIATVLSDMDSDITALEQRRDKTRKLKQGMMQELLTGRIRLV